MKKPKFLIVTVCLFIFFTSCQQPDQKVENETTSKETYELLGYSSMSDWGKHLVAITGCHDCHSPKMMTDKGPVVDPELLLSGHPSAAPAAKVDRAVIEKNGYAACNSMFTAWVGPWGISYAANLTPDPTGIGNWTEENFSRALREGKFKGLEAGRTLLPPMPWTEFANMTDDEVSAIFAYLKSLKPVKNIVPNPDPPTLASAQ